MRGRRSFYGSAALEIVVALLLLYFRGLSADCKPVSSAALLHIQGQGQILQVVDRGMGCGPVSTVPLPLPVSFPFLLHHPGKVIRVGACGNAGISRRDLVCADEQPVFIDAVHRIKGQHIERGQIDIFPGGAAANFRTGGSVNVGDSKE